MRAARVTSIDGPGSVVVDTDAEEPTVTPGHVLVDVHEAGVNVPGVLMSKGPYQMRPELPFVPVHRQPAQPRPEGRLLVIGETEERRARGKVTPTIRSA